MPIFLLLLAAVVAFMSGLALGHAALTRSAGAGWRRRLLWWAAVPLLPAALLLALHLLAGPGEVTPAGPLPLPLAEWERRVSALLAPAYLGGFLLGALPPRERLAAWRRGAAPCPPDEPPPAEAP